jgi:hypothetical protein
VMTAISEIVEATKGNLESYVRLMRVDSVQAHKIVRTI